MIKHNFKAHYKDRDTLIEQSQVTSTPIEQTLLTKYSNKAVINVCEIGNMWAKLGSSKQNIEQNRSEKIAGKKNRWEKK